MIVNKDISIPVEAKSDKDELHWCAKKGTYAKIKDTCCKKMSPVATKKVAPQKK